MTEKQLAIADYETFSKLYIKFDIPGAPDPTKRLEEKKKKVTARKKTTTKKQTENKEKE